MAPDTVNIEELKINVVRAIERLWEQDDDLLKRDLREEAISHRLAAHLKILFEDWDVDCEFDKDGNKQKKTPLPTRRKPQAVKETRVLPDIIIHKRGSSDNLLAIELKKSSNRNKAEIARDRVKIKSYVDDHLGYRIGAFIIIRTDKSIAERYRIGWYKNGDWTIGGV